MVLFSDKSFSASDYTIGAYYFPGWHKDSFFWKDIEGRPGSRSPGRPWPELETPLGLNYAEESVDIMEKQIKWGINYGIDFFAFDWYWSGDKPELNHAITAFLQSNNRKQMKFCLLWANHTPVPTTLKQFTDMLDYWINNYLIESNFFRIDGKPVVIIFSVDQLRSSATSFGKTTADLFNIARSKAIKAGLSGIYFVASTNARASLVKDILPPEGYDALTVYNYHSAAFKGEFTRKVPQSTSYQELLAGYRSQWHWFIQNADLPYLLPMSTGWDSRPWGSDTPHDRSASTPAQFREMLMAGKALMDRYPEKTKRTGVIFAWNEFGEGGYIMPTKQWGFQYLQAVKDVFGP